MATGAVGFHPSLLEFVQKIWRDRENVDMPADIYARYSPLTQLARNWADAVLYATALVEMDLTHCTIARQGRSTEYFDTCASVIAQSVNPPSLLDPDTEDFLYNDFHVFTNKHAVERDVERIYVNLKPPVAKWGIKVLLYVIAMFPSLPRLRSVKICGPFDGRPDSIVIYLADERTANLVGGRLASSPVLSDCFGSNLPPMVTPIRGGLGRAQEPPETAPLYGDGVWRHALRRKPQLSLWDDTKIETAKTSFGLLHSELIWTGLKNYRKRYPAAPRTDDVPIALLEEIRAAYNLARIDPSTPTEFRNRNTIEDRYHFYGVAKVKLAKAFGQTDL